ncbi:hypothetical protein Tco_0139021 [Tanacetum coccineum]
MALIPIVESKESLDRCKLRLDFAAIFIKMGVLQIGISAMVIENKVVTQLCLHPTTLLSSHLIPILRMLFSYTNVPDYFPATPGNTSPDSSNDLTKYILATLVFSPLHDDPYIKVIQAYDAISPPQVTIPPPTILPPSPVLSLSPMFDSRDFFPPEEIPPPKDTKTPVESPIPISPSSSV